MELSELSDLLNISIETLTRLKNKELLDFEDLSNFSDKHKQQLTKLLDLENMGMSVDEIKTYLALSKDQQKNYVRLIHLLQKYRSLTLDSMHKEQEKLYSIDFMIYELKHLKQYSKKNIPWYN